MKVIKDIINELKKQKPMEVVVSVFGILYCIIPITIAYYSKSFEETVFQNIPNVYTLATCIWIILWLISA